MISWLINLIPFFFYLILFFVPLIFLPITSELFEFNKMVLTYLLTIIISALWVMKTIRERKFIYRRTILDIPILVFVFSQFLSTIFSIDQRTSLLGYYSRFNGGLFSTISYCLLYLAFTANMNKKKAIFSLKVLLSSAALISIYGVLEHFGIDKNIWVQDVQNRVFSTLGQPNWLAAWLVALIPVSFAFLLKFRVKDFKFWLYLSSVVLFFSTLLFTKSRSGILGFIVADSIFWGQLLIRYKRELLLKGILFNLIFAGFLLVIGTPWTPNLKSLILKEANVQVTPQGPALEVGGTESGTIRKIVWKGALEVWLHYPIFGSGVETFAFSYYQFRSQEHNLVSEWDFLYNKAHNEYLNFAATSGTFGLFSYLTLIGFAIFLFVKAIGRLDDNKSRDFLNLALLSGYISILVTNFFGFSVVPIQIQFFLFPAIAFTLFKNESNIKEQKANTISETRKIFIWLTLVAGIIFLYSTIKYWYADTKYAYGKSYDDSGNYAQGQKFLSLAINLSPNEAIFHNELANSYAGIALNLFTANKNDQNVETLINLATSESDRAISLSPANVNLLRNRASIFLRFSSINPKYLGTTKDALLLATTKAPTDAKLFYNLALIYGRTGEEDTAIAIAEKTITLKANYKDARYLYALMLIDKGRIPEAKAQLNYILEKIDPNDQNSQKLLQKI